MAKVFPKQIKMNGRQYVADVFRQIGECVDIGDAKNQVPAAVAADLVKTGAAAYVPVVEAPAAAAESAPAERPAPTQAETDDAAPRARGRTR